MSSVQDRLIHRDGRWVIFAWGLGDWEGRRKWLVLGEGLFLLGDDEKDPAEGLIHQTVVKL